ncbi:MAG: Re/Si-specific NAD(P)(+) transhydrogenase subunit alpha [Pseudomonadota bacterium]
MKLAVPKERHAGESRVAASPETARKLIGLGFSVRVESGAGAGANFSDRDYAESGAEIADDYAATVGDADVVVGVRAPEPDLIAPLREASVLVGFFDPHNRPETVEACAQRRIAAFAMELIPRITRAQAMDALSSQSNLAGYKAVLDAAAVYGRALPMMMTAAGTVAPARVLVMGAGVAGLQAIATARRLGAMVSATDVRLAAKEQVESLGATFLMVDSDEAKEAETAGGYAREMSEDYQRAQAALIAEQLKRQDIVILTALIPGRQAPTLLTEEMVKSMRAGSVIVDLAVEQGGNCPLSRPGEIVTVDGVTIVGHRNVPGRLAADASALYARNILSFVTPLVDDGALAIDWEDEIVTGSLLTREGKKVNAIFEGQQQ